MDIHRSLIKDFILPKVKSVFVIDYYEGILGMLKSREEFPYNDFFANPRLRSKTEIIWATESFKGRPKLLIDLDGPVKEEYAYALKERISSIESLISILKDEEGGEPLSELLSKAISFIDEQSVYCGDGNVVIVNWGLIPRKQDLGIGSIYRSGKFVANWDKLHDKPITTDKSMRQNLKPILQSDVKVTKKVIGAAKPVVEKAIQGKNFEEALDTTDKPVNETFIHLEKEKIVAESETRVHKDDIITESEYHTPEEEAVFKNEYFQPLNNTQTKEKAELHDILNENEYTWRAFFRGCWKGFLFLVHKLWLFIALVLLIILTLFLCRGCQGSISRINPFYTPLPEKPVILPVLDGNIGLSEDGKTRIATDRLNILLEKENDDTMLEWAKAFKKEYPGGDYIIFYYNKELYNLQIKVPSDKRELLKKELKEKLSNFAFDVFDEIVYEKDESISFNDPALLDSFRSWYLNAIGAFEAWKEELGDSDIVVAVVDNGFDLNHPELKGKIVKPYNVLNKDSIIKPIITAKGEDAHGTHVAATAIGNGNNASGLLGIAPNCIFMPIQVGSDNQDGAMSSQAVMEGVMYAIANGADVVNVSLGMVLPDIVKEMSEAQQLNYISSYMIQSESMWSRVFDKAKKRNCIIVFAAGNDNVISGIAPNKRSDETIRVSAVDTKLIKAGFSNFGRYPQLDRFYSTVSAPGVSIYNAAPHDNYVNMAGTSMAAPIVTGTVALLKSIDRNLTVKQIVGILQRTGLNVGENIGPLIQVHKAIQMAKGESVPNKCDEITKEINKLQAIIDSLSSLCPNANMRPDTLKFKDAVKNKHGLDGLWKSTTSLVASKDQTPVELYMNFKKLKGTLTIVNKRKSYTAQLEASIKNGTINIVQMSPAVNGDSSFTAYKYDCFSDRKGNLACEATSSENTVIFNLVRIKN